MPRRVPQSPTVLRSLEGRVVVALALLAAVVALLVSLRAGSEVAGAFGDGARATTTTIVKDAGRRRGGSAAERAERARLVAEARRAQRRATRGDTGAAKASARSRRLGLVITALLALLVAGAGLVLTRLVFAPLRRIARAVHRLAEGDGSARTGTRGTDGIGGLARDVDRLAEQIESHGERLRASAVADPLTGLANHRAFRDRLAAEVAEAGADGRFALVIVDIDGFKQLNDRRGEAFGDQVLTSVAGRLRAVLRGGDFAARLGGDEFAVLLPGADATVARAVCDRLRDQLGRGRRTLDEISCSAGFVLFPEDADDAVGLVRLASGTVDWARHAGPGSTRAYDPQHVLVVTEAQRAELGRVLETHDAIRPVFQPIVKLSTGDVAGFEALARFGDGPGGPARPPVWWFSNAQRFGLGAQLERQAVRAALAIPGRPAGAYLSVNLSPTALNMPELRTDLPDDLRFLVIEVTEHEEIEDDAQLRACLAPFRARGARVAVDDAGSGYAGLQQVMRLDADLIKLDRALVTGIHRDRAKRAMVQAFVAFARSTNADLCAEGVEELEELRVLAEMGVTYAQGYVLARPGPAWATVSDEASAVCREVHVDLTMPITGQRLTRAS